MRHRKGRAGGSRGTLPHTDPVSSEGEQRGESREPQPAAPPPPPWAVLATWPRVNWSGKLRPEKAECVAQLTLTSRHQLNPRDLISLSPERLVPSPTLTLGLCLLRSQLRLPVLS